MHFTVPKNSFTILGATAGLVSGFVVGGVRLALNLISVDECKSDYSGFWWSSICGDFNHFAIFLALVVALVRFHAFLYM